MTKRYQHIYVNGYGIPKDILRDGNYALYLGRIVAHYLADYTGAHVVLAGGATDPARPLLTEACEMKRWLDFYAAEWHLDTELIECGTTVAENLRGLMSRVSPSAHIVVFCEWARQDWLRFLVGQLLPNAEVKPIIFDRGPKRRWSVRIRQWLKLPGRLAEWYLHLRPYYLAYAASANERPRTGTPRLD